MNDKELADKVVALGVGARFPVESQTPRYHLDSSSGRQNTGYLMPELFVRDWRVAGALMENVRSHKIGSIKWITLMRDIRRIPLNAESLPRAIIEACVEALSERATTTG